MLPCSGDPDFALKPERSEARLPVFKGSNFVKLHSAEISTKVLRLTLICKVPY